MKDLPSKSRDALELAYGELLRLYRVAQLRIDIWIVCAKDYNESESRRK